MAPLQRAQAPTQTQSLKHFTHPQHPLFQTYLPNEYLCDGCTTLGFGSRYNCPTCSFDLHEHCATCSLTLTSHLHPHHQLTLVNRPGNGHMCDLCGEQVHGIFYTCGPCGFDFHPLCTQLPLNFHHHFHPQHVLTFQPGNSGFCVVFFGGCNSWRYRCSMCNIDIHLECVVAPCDASPSCDGGGGGGGGGYGGGYAAGVPAFGNWTNMNMNMYQGVNQMGDGGSYQNGSSRGRKVLFLVAKLVAQTVLISTLGVSF